MRCASTPASRPDPIGYTLKRLILGRPLVTAQLRSDGLSNPVALGVLSPDAISSNAYGVEEILIELLPFAGLAAVTLLLPITGVVLLILVFSNGIVTLTGLAVALLMVTGGSVNALVPFYAIGVFYVTKFGEAVYVLQCFTKKTQKTEKKDIGLGVKRYSEAKMMYAQRKREGGGP